MEKKSLHQLYQSLLRLRDAAFAKGYVLNGVLLQIPEFIALSKIRCMYCLRILQQITETDTAYVISAFADYETDYSFLGDFLYEYGEDLSNLYFRVLEEMGWVVTYVPVGQAMQDYIYQEQKSCGTRNEAAEYENLEERIPDGVVSFLSEHYAPDMPPFLTARIRELVKDEVDDIAYTDDVFYLGNVKIGRVAQFFNSLSDATDQQEEDKNMFFSLLHGIFNPCVVDDWGESLVKIRGCAYTGMIAFRHNDSLCTGAGYLLCPEHILFPVLANELADDCIRKYGIP